MCVRSNKGLGCHTTTARHSALAAVDAREESVRVWRSGCELPARCANQGQGRRFNVTLLSDGDDRGARGRGGWETMAAS